MAAGLLQGHHISLRRGRKKYQSANLFLILCKLLCVNGFYELAAFLLLSAKFQSLLQFAKAFFIPLIVALSVILYLANLFSC